VKIEVYQDRAELWRWRLVAANGRIVADSGEGYSRRRDALRAVRTFRGLAWRAPVVEVAMSEQAAIDRRLAELRA
jgi:uncharacterized protein YegP (UPF0339 family)